MKIIKRIINAIFILLFIFAAVLYIPNKVNRYDKNGNFIKFVGIRYYPIWYNIPQKPVNILKDRIAHTKITDLLKAEVTTDVALASGDLDFSLDDQFKIEDKYKVILDSYGNIVSGNYRLTQPPYEYERNYIYLTQYGLEIFCLILFYVIFQWSVIKFK